MSMKHILILILGLSLGACAFKKDDAVEETTKPVDVIETLERQPFNGELNEKNVSVEFKESPEPGSYIAAVTWPKEVPAMKVSVDGNAFEIIKGSNSYAFPTYYSKTIAIHLVALNAIGGESATYFIEKTSPKDYILKEDLNLSEDTTIDVNRFYFQDGYRILTNGFNLTIYASKLYTQLPVNPNSSRMHPGDAHIRTTTAGFRAILPRQLNGSTITIQAKKAIGQLRVAMIGFNGIDGQDGASAPAARDGANGTNGVIESIADLCVSDDGRPCRRPTIECRSNPTNGTNGADGLAGQNGGNGTNGGNSGILFVNVDDYSEFKLEVAQQRGLPGKGGAAGKGSLGGKGGKAGTNPNGKCASAKDGAAGANGKDGQPGLDGKPGILGDVSTNTVGFSRYEID